MDNILVEVARKHYADDIFDTVMRCYNEANKDYLQEQIQIASEYLTDEQKKELQKKTSNTAHKITYKDCADAMLMMWMEDVVTDSEYNRIMDKLNEAHKRGDV